MSLVLMLATIALYVRSYWRADMPVVGRWGDDCGCDGTDTKRQKISDQDLGEGAINAAYLYFDRHPRDQLQITALPLVCQLQ